jgi:hypothetical protein
VRAALFSWLATTSGCGLGRTNQLSPCSLSASIRQARCVLLCSHGSPFQGLRFTSNKPALTLLFECINTSSKVRAALFSWLATSCGCGLGRTNQPSSCFLSASIRQARCAFFSHGSPFQGLRFTSNKPTLTLLF